MPKQSGLGDNFYVAGFDLSGDIGALGRIGGGPATLDVTAINKSAFERIGGMRDGALEFTSFFNPDVGQAHDRLSNLPVADQVLTYCRGTSLGSPAASMTAKQLGYDPSRGNDGALTFETTAQASGTGLEWGTQLTPGKQTDTVATNGTGVDFGSASSFGLQAYLHVFAFTGTSVTVKIQQSSDNGVGDAWTDVTSGTFAVVAGITSERIATAVNLVVERWLRVVTTGVFTSTVFACSVMRNYTEVE